MSDTISLAVIHKLLNEAGWPEVYHLPRKQVFQYVLCAGYDKRKIDFSPEGWPMYYPTEIRAEEID